MLERQFQPTQSSEFKRADQTHQTESLSLSSAESSTVLKPAVKEELTFISPFDFFALRQQGLEEAYFFWKKLEAGLQKQGKQINSRSVSQEILAAIVS